MKLKYTLRGMGIGLILASILFFFLRGTEKQAMSDDEVRKRAIELGMLTSETLAEKKLDELRAALSVEKDEKLEKETETSEKTVSGVERKTSPSSSKKEDGTASEHTPENKKTEEKSGEEIDQERGSGKEKGQNSNHSETERKEKTVIQGGDPAETKRTGKNPPETGTSGNTSSEQKQEEASQTPKIEEDKPKSEIKSYTYKVIPGSSAVRLCKDLEALGLIQSASDFNHYLAVNNYATRIRNGTFTFYSNETYYEIAEKLVSRQMNP